MLNVTGRILMTENKAVFGCDLNSRHYRLDNLESPA